MKEVIIQVEDEQRIANQYKEQVRNHKMHALQEYTENMCSEMQNGALLGKIKGGNKKLKKKKKSLKNPAPVDN